MREFDPNNRPMIDDSVGRGNPNVDDRRPGIGTLGIVISAIALALGLGLFAWTVMDDRVADNRETGATTGSSAPSPSNPPPAPGPRGQGESNSTR
jgi:hypothetical protein